MANPSRQGVLQRDHAPDHDGQQVISKESRDGVPIKTGRDASYESGKQIAADVLWCQFLPGQVIQTKRLL